MRESTVVDLAQPAGGLAVRQLKFVGGGLVIVLAIAYLALTSLQNTMVYYLTVSELQARGPSAQPVRVAGTVVPGSIVRSADGLAVTFTIADAGGRLPVAYRGVIPDIFGENIEVVVEGRYRADGLFEAHTLLAKCPSRYEALETGR